MTNSAPPTSARPKIRILAVDDHFIVRTGLASSINFEPDLEVVAEAANGREACELYEHCKPDITLMDLRLPELSGAEATAIICRKHPEARTIILSTYNSDEDIYRAFQAGARGYLLKTASREELLQTIRDVHAGKLCVPASVAQRLAERTAQEELTPRESEVLRLLAKGLSNKQIGARLGVAEVTIKLHVSNLFGKLKVADRTQAVTTALQKGLIRIED